MKAFTRGLGLVLFSSSLLGFAGCSEDNETEMQKLSKDMGDPGARNPKEKKVDQAEQPADRGERFKQRDPKKAMGPNYPNKK